MSSTPSSFEESTTIATVFIAATIISVLVPASISLVFLCIRREVCPSSVPRILSSFLQSISGLWKSVVEFGSRRRVRKWREIMKKKRENSKVESVLEAENVVVKIMTESIREQELTTAGGDETAAITTNATTTTTISNSEKAKEKLQSIIVQGKTIMSMMMVVRSSPYAERLRNIKFHKHAILFRHRRENGLRSGSDHAAPNNVRLREEEEAAAAAEGSSSSSLDDDDDDHDHETSSEDIAASDWVRRVVMMNSMKSPLSSSSTADLEEEKSCTTTGHATTTATTNSSSFPTTTASSPSYAWSFRSNAAKSSSTRSIMFFSPSGSLQKTPHSSRTSPPNFHSPSSSLQKTPQSSRTSPPNFHSSPSKNSQPETPESTSSSHHRDEQDLKQIRLPGCVVPLVFVVETGRGGKHSSSSSAGRCLAAGRDNNRLSPRYELFMRHVQM